MPFSTEKFSHGYEGGKQRVQPKSDGEAAHQGRVAPKPTVVTVKPDGTVTAHGPEAPAAPAEAHRSIKRVQTAVAQTDRSEAEHPTTGSDVSRRQTFRPKGLPVPGVVTKVVHAIERQDSTSAPVRNFVKDEADTLRKGIEEGIGRTGSTRELTTPTGTPSERAAALTIAAPITADEIATVPEKVAAKVTANAGNALSAKAIAAEAVHALKAVPRKEVAKVKAVPQRIKAAPASGVRAAKDLKTPAGRKAVVRKAEHEAIHHPVKSGIGAAAVTPPDAEVAGINPGQRARAFLEGTANATWEHPEEVGKATLEGALGAFTAPLALTKSAADSVEQGSLAPLGATAAEIGKGTFELGKKLASGNQRQVEETTEKETGLLPDVGLPHLARDLKNSAKVDELRSKVRNYAGDRRISKRQARSDARRKSFEEHKPVHTKRIGQRVEGRGTAKRLHVKREEAEKPIPGNTTKLVTDSTRNDDPYLFQHLGALIEKNRGRHVAAREIDRGKREGEIAGDRSL